MKKYLAILVSLVVLNVGMVSPAFAQTMSNDTQFAYTFGSVGLFFRDISQRIQLIFTVDDAKDATMRLKFAQENVELVSRMVNANADAKVVEQATRLADRAKFFITTVNERQEDWSKGDSRAIAELTEQADSYFESAQNLFNELVNTPHSGLWDGMTDTVGDELLAESQKTRNFIQTDLARKTNTQTTSSNSVTVSTEGDKDADGLEDKDEELLGLSTANFDTDGDGLSDRAEIERYGTDPTKDDSDNDGYRDGLEVLKKYNPVGAGNFSTSTLKKDGFVFVRSKMNLQTLSPSTLKLLQDASLGNKILSTSPSLTAIIGATVKLQP